MPKKLACLIGCECSGAVRRELRALGHDAWSCDLKPAEDDSPHHYHGDLFDAVDDRQWDLLIAHPDCTYLTVANNGPMTRGCSLYTAEEAQARREAAIAFVLRIADLPIPAIAIENPIGVLSSRWRKPDQIIQPWQFGDDASKATCLWLKGLPPLVHTDVLPGGRKARRANQTPSGQNRLGPSEARRAERARTYPGIAKAMASQWAGHLSQ
jgi:site-specific DNA-cytosine methylase